jgi:spore coat polysaccharide biosynthesis protein SpsF (cytidylyltransferase family)
VAAIVQARIGSTRLPGKVLADLCGRPVIEHVLQRASQIAGIDAVVLAVPASSSDDALAEVGRRAGVIVVRGNADDVLDRYRAAAYASGAAAIVRITADCPLLDPAVSSQVVSRFVKGDVDYVSNIHPPSFPDGYDTEAFSLAALDTAWSEASDPYEREHVTPFIWRRPDRFTLANVSADQDRSTWRLTVDTADDLRALRDIWSRFAPESIIGLNDIIALQAEEPRLVPTTS